MRTSATARENPPPKTRLLLALSVLAVVLSAIIAPLLTSSTTMSNSTYPGDSIILEPEMHYNHVKRINAPPSAIYPWILQLGKGRGGWYLPASYERFLPKSMHASRSINPAWTSLAVGDRVADYGFNEVEDVFDVAEIKVNEALVYESERYGTIFTWALILEPKDGGATDLRLRFRGRIQRTGWQRKLLVFGGGFMDWATTAPMLAGLKERAESECSKTK